MIAIKINLIGAHLHIQKPFNRKAYSGFLHMKSKDVNELRYRYSLMSPRFDTNNIFCFLVCPGYI
jgi:hypothetical protein